MCSSHYHVAPSDFYRELVRREVTGGALRLPEAPSPAPDFADVHIASSCLQKALRRGEGEIALAAALYLLRHDEARLWRWLVVCAFEDFGLSDLSAAAKVVAVAGNRGLRQVLGTERVLAWLIAMLGGVAKDRRLDDLYALGAGLYARRTSAEAGESSAIAAKGDGLVGETTRLIGRCERMVPGRSFRSLSVEACERALTEMAQAGLCDHALFALCLNGARLSRCLLPLLVPLAIEATEEAGGLGEATAEAVPAAPSLRGVPAYAFDGFTRVGRALLGDLAKGEMVLQPVLVGLDQRARIDVLHHLLFFAEGARCERLRSDALSIALHRHAVALGARLPQPDADAAVAIMEELLPKVHAMRGRFPARINTKDDFP